MKTASSFFAFALLFGLSLATDDDYCPQQIDFAIGSFTSLSWLPSANGSGITFISMKKSEVKQKLVLKADTIGSNPSYCARGREDAIYCSSQLHNGSIIRIDQGGSVATVKSPLGESVHVAVLPHPGSGGGERVLAAHYGSSGVTSFLRTGDKYKSNTVTIPTSVATFKEGRQDAPHPHQILLLGNGDILVPDLGSDYVWRYGTGSDGTLYGKGGLKVKAGDGPRHMVRGKGQNVYLLNELSNTVTRIMGCGEFRECERKTIVPSTPDAGFTAGAILISDDAKYLYVSVRKPDMESGLIVGYALSASGEIGEKIGSWSSMGAHPRDFYLLDNGVSCKSFLVIANMNTNNVVFVERSKKTGELASKPYAAIRIDTPTSVLPINVIPGLRETECSAITAPPKVEGSWGELHSKLWWSQLKKFHQRRNFCHKCNYLCK